MTENKKTDNLALRFLAASEKFKQNPFLKYEIEEKPSSPEEKTLSYGEFMVRANLLARHLLHLGVRPGMKTALLVPAGPEWCIAFTGVVLAGAIAVPVNEAAPDEDLKAVLADCSPEALVANRETKNRFSPLSGGLDHFPMMIDLEEFSASMMAESKTRSTKEGAALTSPPAQSSAQMDEPAMIIYTSGTTGLQKGVTLTHGNLISDALGVIETGIVGEGENLLLGLPFYHSYPIMCFIASFLSGASLTLLASIKGKELARVAKARGVTIMIAVPQMLELLDASIKKRLPKPLASLLPLFGALRGKTGMNPGKVVFRKVHAVFGGCLRLIASGGARLAPEVMRDLEAVGFTIVEGYGLTETSPIVTFNPVKKRKPGSAGKPIRGVRVRIENGEVLLSGPMLMSGYWLKPEETARAIEDGWLHTGDTGWLDDEGYLFITGREKEILVLSSGKNVAPDEVEKRYRESPLIKDMAVYEENGALKGVIVPDLDYARGKGLANLREETGWELMRLGQGLPPFMRLTGFSLIKGPLPKTPLGKIKRFRLGELLKTAVPEAKETGSEFLGGPGEKIARVLNSVAGRKTGTAIRAEDNLELDLGLDSLKRIELLSALEEEFLPSLGQEKRTLRDDFLLDVQTAGELLKKMVVFLSSGEEKPVPEGENFFLPLPFAREGREKEIGKISFSMSEKAATFLLYYLLKLLAKALFRLKSKGLQNLPDGPFILAPNHSSFLDAFVIAASLPKRNVRSLFFVGWETYFRGLMAHTLKVVHVIPIDREHLLGGALRVSAGTLRQGYALCVFPEGGRSFDGRLMELKPGIAAMAVNEGVPIVPAWIEGAHKALPRGGSLLKPVMIEVRYGRPLFPEASGPGDLGNRNGKKQKLLSALRDSLNALSRGAE